MALQLVLDSRQFLDLSNRMFDIAKRGVPHAARNALNQAAFETRERYREEVARSLIHRNTWTMRSIGMERAKGIDLHRLTARVGSTQEYMALQESGGVQRKRGEQGKPIPTRIASGEGEGSAPRQRLVRRPNRLANIALGLRGRGNRKQRNAVAIRIALATGRKFVFLELERRKGIFRIVGGRRRTRLRMVWDLTRSQVTVPANPMLERSIDAMQSRFGPIYIDAMEAQIKRALKKQISSTFAVRLDARANRIVAMR